jgi:hypothetical protein
MVRVPPYEEFSAKAIYDMVKDMPRFMDYLPDFESLQRPLSRDYLFNVNRFNTFHLPTDHQYNRQQVL